jgi:hypothetical protein
MFGETTDKIIGNNPDIVHPNKLFMGSLLGSINLVEGAMIRKDESQVLK